MRRGGSVRHYGMLPRAKKQREIRSDADLDSMADFFESTLAGIRMAVKAGKSGGHFGILRPLREEGTWDQVPEPLPVDEQTFP